MFYFSKRKKKQFIKLYKELLQMALNDQELPLSPDKQKAVGQKILDDVFQKAFEKLDVPDDRREAFLEEIEKIVKEEFPESFLDTPVIYTGKGFQGKN